MTRISAGNTLTNQYAPPFVVSNNVTTNWQLRWNADLIAFEAFDPDENVIAAGFDTIEQALFVGVTAQQVYVLPWVAANEQSLYITINGVKQHTNTYTIAASSTTTTVTMGVATGDVEFIGLQSTGGATVELATALGTGVASQQVVLSWLAPSDQSLLVSINGLKQDTTAYAISSNALFTASTVTFNGTITLNDEIEIVGITTTGETPASPVETTNLEADTGTSKGLASTKTVTGETQILSFKNITAGTGVTLTDNTTSIAIAAVVPTFVSGPGTSIIDDATTTDPLKVRGLAAGDRVALSVIGTSPNEQVQFDYNIGHKTITNADSPYTQLAAERFIVVNGLAAVTGITLLDASTIPTGDTVTIKNQTAGVFAITLTPAAGQIEDQASRGNLTATYVINTAGGYVTLYSDGTNYHIIAEG